MTTDSLKQSVWLIDDDPVLGATFEVLLRNEPAFHPPRVFSCAQDALRRGFRHRPDVILVDLMLPGDSGLRFLRSARPRLPETQLVVLSSADQDEWILAAFESGADGYLLKGPDPAELLSRLREAARGAVLVSWQVGRRLMGNYRRLLLQGSQAPCLKPLELRLLELTHAGLTCRDIAVQLRVPVQSVYAMNKALYSKLSVRSRTAAAARWVSLTATNLPEAGAPDASASNGKAPA